MSVSILERRLVLCGQESHDGEIMLLHDAAGNEIWKYIPDDHFRRQIRDGFGHVHRRYNFTWSHELSKC